VSDEPRIDDAFIEYIYGAACCDELRATRDLLLEATGLSEADLILEEENKYTFTITQAYADCGI
jgi:hypothetical protein